MFRTDARIQEHVKDTCKDTRTCSNNKKKSLVSLHVSLQHIHVHMIYIIFSCVCVYIIFSWRCRLPYVHKRRLSTAKSRVQSGSQNMFSVQRLSSRHSYRYVLICVLYMCPYMCPYIYARTCSPFKGSAPGTTNNVSSEQSQSKKQTKKKLHYSLIMSHKHLAVYSETNFNYIYTIHIHTHTK